MAWSPPGMSYALGFELLSLFLFIYAADSLSPLFVGAMCAAGSLNVNEFGYPALILKITDFLLAGVWPIVNFTDNKASDYPLIRIKYGLLICITSFLAAETLVQGAYLLGLKPDIITSCCGTIFTTDANTVMSGLIGLPRVLSQAGFYFSTAVTVLLGLFFYRKGKGGCLFSISAMISFLFSIVALISFISLYFYELPTHHCPFCILHPEYGYVVYLLYISLLAGAVSGLGIGAVMPFHKIKSLGEILPRIQRKLALVSVLSFSTFLLISGYVILFSHLSLAAY
jgi:hypothetical protein